MTMAKKMFLLAALAVLASAGIADATPVTYNFVRITNNGNANVGSQLSVEVIDKGTTTGGVSLVGFQFFNKVGTPSSITDIYFADGTLLGIASISVSGNGPAFAQYAVPAELPGAKLASPPFVTHAGFSADSDSPVAPNGVNAAGEWVEITFSLINGQQYANTIAALNNGGLRIGLKVQAIGTTNGSDSYVNKVPDGGMTVSLLGLALAGMGLMARRWK